MKIEYICESCGESHDTIVEGKFGICRHCEDEMCYYCRSNKFDTVCEECEDECIDEQKEMDK